MQLTSSSIVTSLSKLPEYQKSLVVDIFKPCLTNASSWSTHRATHQATQSTGLPQLSELPLNLARQKVLSTSDHIAQFLKANSQIGSQSNSWDRGTLGVKRELSALSSLNFTQAALSGSSRARLPGFSAQHQSILSLSSLARNFSKISRTELTCSDLA